MDFNIIEKRIDELRDEMIEDLRSLIAIRSVAEENDNEKKIIAKANETKMQNNPNTFYPFGRKVQDAMELMFSYAEKDGIEYKNIDNYGGHIEIPGEESSEIMGILCHLDVVPEGDGWTFDPYVGEIKDNILYGRGAIDNKGPTIACYYAMKVLKELNFRPKKTIRLILGLDEETNWNGMKYYLDNEKAPDFGFTPDGDFPVIHGEKGIIVFDLGKKLSKVIGKGLELRKLKGGNAANMVPDKAKALIFSSDASAYEKIKEEIADYNKNTGQKLLARNTGKSLEVISKGISAHGALPHLGENAISTLMQFLGKLNFLNDDVNDFVAFYNEHIGFQQNGESLGCFLKDDVSDETILNVGVIEGDIHAIKTTINVRYPVTKTEEDVYESMNEVLSKYNLGILKGKHQKPIYASLDNPLIVELMDVYHKQTGRVDEKPKVIGGGTYARAVDNVFAFGAAYPDDEEIAHQKDEYIKIEHLIKITKIYAEAIYRLTK